MFLKVHNKHYNTICGANGIIRNNNLAEQHDAKYLGETDHGRNNIGRTFSIESGKTRNNQFSINEDIFISSNDSCNFNLNIQLPT